MLVTSIFFLWFAWDAIICENAFELLASGVLGLAVCARIIYFVVRRSVSLLTIHRKCITMPCFAYDDAMTACKTAKLELQLQLLLPRNCT